MTLYWEDPEKEEQLNDFIVKEFNIPHKLITDEIRQHVNGTLNYARYTLRLAWIELAQPYINFIKWILDKIVGKKC